MSYLDKLKPISSTQTPSSVGASYQQKLKPISQPESRESRIQQGLPVGTGGRTTPTAAGNILRSIVKPVAKVASSMSALDQASRGVPANKIQPLKSKYLGDVERIGAGFDVRQGLTPENVKAVKDAVGTGMELSSYIPVGTGANIMRKIAQQPFKQSLKQSVATVGAEGAIQGILGEGGRALQENADMGEFLKRSAIGTGLGGVIGAGAGMTGNLISRRFAQKPVEMISSKVDDKIRKLYKGVTGDSAEIEQSAFKTRKALELLNKESGSIQVPDTSKPLGSGALKQFDIAKAKPNELITAVNNLTEKVVNNAKTAAQNASEQGLKIDTTTAKSIVDKAVQDKQISKAAGERLLTRILNSGGDPVEVFDWIQNVNRNWKADMTKSAQIKQVAEDVARDLRVQLNTITDRTGYSENIANIYEFKKLLVNIAKKANKGFNPGNLTDEMAIDAAFATLTANPAYLSRTLGSVALRGILSGFKRRSALKPLRSTIKNIGKLPTETKLPSTEPKILKLALPAPKAGSPRVRIESGQSIPVAPVGSSIETTAKTPVAGRYTPPKTLNNNQAGFADPKILGLAGITGGVVGASQIPRTFSYQRPPEQTPIIKPVNKNIPENKLGNALMQLESSGGTNRKNADPGEMKWLVGLTEVAIKELARVKRLPQNFNKNNKDHVIKAGIEYFKLMQERNPQLTPGEVYTDKYWTQWETPEQRQKKIEEFNSLIS